MADRQEPLVETPASGGPLSWPTRIGRGGVSSAGVARVLSRMTVIDTERTAVDTALDTLLGQGQDPGGVRADVITAIAHLTALENAVTQLVNDVPSAPDRVRLVREVRNLDELLALLGASEHPEDIGTASRRLLRILELAPSAPRTVAGLQTQINDTMWLDEKVLLGYPASIAAGTSAVGDIRRLVGGHSPSILTDPPYIVSDRTDHPTLTTEISFQQLLRDDNGVAAQAVETGAANNPAAVALAAANAADAEANAVVLPAKPPRMPQDVYDRRNATVIDAQAKAAEKAVDVARALGAIGALAKTARTSHADASAVKPFYDGVVDPLSKALVGIRSARRAAPDSAVLNTQETNVNAAMTSFMTQGPVISAKKPTSTLAPGTMTEDEILEMGHETAKEPVKLIKFSDKPDKRPADGALVRTKHVKLVNGIVWVAIRENVTFREGTPPEWEGGKLAAGYPTGDSAIPADPTMGTADVEGYHQLHS